MTRWLLMCALVALVPAGAMAQADEASIEQRLQRVEDELAIHRIIADYAGLLDARDYAAYSELFAPDGVWTKPGGGGRAGRAAIRQMLEQALGPADEANVEDYHLVSNPQVELSGDRATATSRFLFVTRGEGGQPTPALAGLYHDELVRQGGRWLIARRVAEDVMPTEEEWQRMVVDLETRE